MVFDLEKGSTLYIDLAKSNSRAKRARIGVCFNFFILPFRIELHLKCKIRWVLWVMGTI